MQRLLKLNVFSIRKTSCKRFTICLKATISNAVEIYCYQTKLTRAHLPFCTRQRWTWQCRKTWSEIPEKVNILKEKRLVVSIPFWRTSTVVSSGLAHLGREEGFSGEGNKGKIRAWQNLNAWFVMYLVWTRRQVGFGQTLE